MHRYERLNLIQNPFAEPTFAEAVRMADVDLLPILDALQRGESVQIIGKHGRGKTTTLRVLSCAVPRCDYVRIWSRDFTGQWPPAAPQLPPDVQLLALDEADALLPWTRIKLMRRVPQVVLATHRDIGLSMRLAGHKVATIRLGHIPTNEWLRNALNRRIETYRLGPGAIVTLSQEEVEDLRQRHKDNLRAIERELYDDFLRRCPPSPHREHY